MPSATAPAKVILFGEHAVVYDKLGLSAAVDLWSKAVIKKNSSKNIFVTDKKLGQHVEWSFSELEQFKRTIDKLKEEKNYPELKNIAKKDAFAAVKYIVSYFVDEYGFEPFELILNSRIPTASGLGSGSSLFASVAAVLCDYYEIAFDRKKISDMAYQGDIIAHGGTPSGIDNNTVTYGGYIAFRKSKGVRPLDIRQKIPLVIGHTGISGNTAELVAKVRSLFEQEPDKKKLLDRINDITESAILAIKDNDLFYLGELMNENHSLLCNLGVSHSAIEKLVKSARSAGAFGAKLSGAGGGGIMIALGDDVQNIAKAIEKAGGKPIVTDIGVEGVQVSTKAE